MYAVAYKGVCYQCSYEGRTDTSCCPVCRFPLIMEPENTPPGGFRLNDILDRPTLREGAPPLPGVDPGKRKAQLMAEALSGLPIERAFVVHGAEGWDEPTPLGPFTVLDVRPGNVKAEMRSPSDYGLDLCGAHDLAGGDASANAKALRAVLTGEDKGAHRDALLLGTSLALEVVGRVNNPRDGVQLARQAIESGAARRTLDALAAFGKGSGL